MRKKLKIRKSISRRFRVTKTGKVLHAVSFGRHLRHHKSKSQIRKFKKVKPLTGKRALKIKKLLGK